MFGPVGRIIELAGEKGSFDEKVLPNENENAYKFSTIRLSSLLDSETITFDCRKLLLHRLQEALASSIEGRSNAAHTR